MRCGENVINFQVNQIVGRGIFTYLFISFLVANKKTRIHTRLEKKTPYFWWQSVFNQISFFQALSSKNGVLIIAGELLPG
jgi:hypothetical protein